MLVTSIFSFSHNVFFIMLISQGRLNTGSFDKRLKKKFPPFLLVSLFVCLFYNINIHELVEVQINV